MTIPYYDAGAIARLLPPGDAVAAIERALRDGLDPAAGVPRMSFKVPAGELLLMPASSATHAGVKVAAVAERAVPRVNAVYVLFDGETLRPVALFDGAALTALRTPAVSVAAVRPFLKARIDVVIFGAGPQGLGHRAALGAVAELGRVDIARRATGVPESIATADVVVCATTAREPLFDSARLRGDVVVIAIGSHEPDAREVDTALCRRATVIVEDVATALRECGDVILAGLGPEDLVPIGRPNTRKPGPVLFKGSGMAWQDLVVAEAVLRADQGADPLRA